jgi:hypothetical protein
MDEKRLEKIIVRMVHLFEADAKRFEDLWDDLLTAAENRLSIFEKVLKLEKHS